MRWRSLVLVIAVLATACSSSSKHARSTTTTTSISTTTTSTTAPTTSTTAFGGTTSAVNIPSTASGTASMTALRVAGQPGFDRVVIEFSGTGAPGVQVNYDNQPVADGSGAPVAVQGITTLKVRLFPATSIEYTGQGRVQASDTKNVTEVVRGGDFEAVLTWFVGLRTKTPFRVAVLQNPTRVVVDVAAS